MSALDDRLGPLSALVGTWAGTGRGVYPTIAAFDYTEEITFADGGV
ncbi:MAG: THAP4-like, heme-binding beta-barrel domain, partial [Actinomycetota bacterium]